MTQRSRSFEQHHNYSFRIIFNIPVESLLYAHNDTNIKKKKISQKTANPFLNHEHPKEKIDRDKKQPINL